MTAPAESREASAAEALAEGFAHHVQSWARRLRGADADTATLGRAAQELSLATSNGHVCLRLDVLAATLVSTPAALRRELLASGVVGSADAPGALPLLLDADDRLYLHRLFDFEQRLARRLMRAAQAPPAEIDGALRQQLHALFAADAGRPGGAADWQQLAAALALRQRLTVISGGPGTGKTTAVVKLLACLIAQNPACRIALAAPTGKAAARMSDAIRQRAAALPAVLRERLPAESFTVHRLLGVTPNPGRFVHHADHRLAIDVLVVDEASMLDLALATRLLEAVPESARIVLLGDKDQLAAVESGAVFAELGADPTLTPACRADLADACGLAPEALVTPAPTTPGTLHDSVVWFTQNYRFASDSGIARLAADINQGRAPAALATLRSDAALDWLEDEAAAPGAATLQRAFAGYTPYFDAVLAGTPELDKLSAAFDRFRVLCALREGPRGVLALNGWLGAQARQRLQPAGAEALSPWFVGRPVMVLRNDPVLGLFNGDIGFTLPDAQGTLQVHFPAAGRWRALPPARLPAHETAFALTVHKSQGSEFDEVMLLLPATRSRVLSRELLYTGVTRARQRLLLCGGAQVLQAAIESPTERHSGLLARLREAGADNGAPT